jgi:hypothetical protein
MQTKGTCMEPPVAKPGTEPARAHRVMASCALSFFIKLTLFYIILFCFTLFITFQQRNSVLIFILPISNLIPSSVSVQNTFNCVYVVAHVKSEEGIFKA